MKVCEYCGNTVDDRYLFCPYCNSTSFQNKCPRCGAVSEGSDCPVCNARLKEEQAARERAASEAEARAKANAGLGWKTVLTFFLPFIGGYFLINANVKTGFRIFGIAWCALLAISVGISSSGSSALARLLACAMCLAPIAAYLFREMRTSPTERGASKKAMLVALAALVVTALVCAAWPR